MPARSPHRSIQVLLHALALIAALMLAPVPASAGSAVGSVLSSVTLQGNCNVTAQPLAFGVISGIATSSTSQSSLALTCTRSTAYSISLNMGTSSYATGTGSSPARFMTSAQSSILPYYLYQDSAMTVGWNTGANVYSGVGVGTAQTIPVYGRTVINLGGGTVVPVGTYADTVTVTVAY